MNVMNKKIAFQDGIITKEKLPLEYVHYPGFYGSFFGFSQYRHSTIYLCECSKPAFNNYLLLRDNNQIKNFYPEKEFILSSNDFPIELVKYMMSHTNGSKEEILMNIEYKQGICHQCNRAVPSYRYCNEMYGGLFKQTYGWYINNKSYEIGINPLNHIPISKNIPDELFNLINIEPMKYYTERKKLINTENIRDFDIIWQKQKRKINGVVENEVRASFEFKKIGDAWAGETTLFNIILRMFPDTEIIRHHRPEYLEYLEMDIFIPDLRFGIEYQGQQHYEPVKHWGGKEAFLKQKERDKRKRKLCKKNGIKLIEIKYNEPLTEEYIYNRIQQFLNEPLIQ